MERRKILEKFESQSEFLKAKVAAGIENNRKGYGTLEIKSEGTPVAGAKVHLNRRPTNLSTAQIFLCSTKWKPKRKIKSTVSILRIASTWQRFRFIGRI